MNLRTYILHCEGPACLALFIPPVKPRGGRPSLPVSVTEVRHEAKLAGWQTTFHPGTRAGQVGFYVDHCPACKERADTLPEHVATP